MKRVLLACLLAAASMSASAIPVTYDLSFDATTGPSGSGALTWDGSTSVMTDFTWDFGPGLNGGIRNDVLALVFFGANVGAALWELISGEDILAQVGPGGIQGVQTASTHFLVGATYPSVTATFFMNGVYNFGAPLSAGTISTSERVVSVSEPVTLALFAIGALAAFALARRRRIR